MISKLRDRFPITWLCSQLGVARSGFYAAQQRQRNPGPRAQQNAAITAQVATIFEQHRGFYGAPRIHRELRAAGLKVERHRVARLMQRSELKARRRRRFRPCSDTAVGAPGIATNLLQQDFVPPAPNRCWVGDMTYIRTTEGWRYLAVWIDLYSHRVVGWAMGTTMETTLVLEALMRAVGHRKIEPEKLLIHTDQGSQYRSNAYRQMLEIHKITPSMSAKGCCWDNAVEESFFCTLKHELDLDDNAKALNTPQLLQRQLAFWIDGYYNRERRHSTIGDVSPINYEQQFISASTLTPVVP